VILSSVGLAIYLVATEGSDNIIRMLTIIDYRWLGIALASTVLYWLVDAAVLLMVLRTQSRRVPYRICVRSSLIGMLFGLITPLQSGNITAQVVVLKQQGLESGNAVAVMLVKSIITMVSSLVLMSAAVVLKGSSLFIQSPGFFWVVALGLLLNFLVIVVMLVAGIRENLVLSIVNAIIRVLTKLHVIKHPQKVSARTAVEVARLHGDFMIIRQKSGMVLQGIVLGLIGLLGSYQIAYFLYRGFGLVAANYLEVVTGQVFSMTIQSIVPLPGGVGITDGGFYFILVSMFTKTFINFALIFWRFFTFYLPILVGIIMLTVYKTASKDPVA
jgi:glycosyltransferase 2 family protein